MRAITHAAFAVVGSAVALGTANPLLLGISLVASQLPDVDTSSSVVGRVLLPISKRLEERYPHRTLTHSFIFTACLALVTYPLFWLLNRQLGPDLGLMLWWQAMILGYFLGWFSDVFTRQGVAAFFPSQVRLVIPGNPRMRIKTGSGAEFFVLALLVIIGVIVIGINASGGIMRGMQTWIGSSSTAVDLVLEDTGKRLMAQIDGRFTMSQEPVSERFEIVKPLTRTDLLVKDKDNRLFRAGTASDANILISHITIEPGEKVINQVQELKINNQDLSSLALKIPKELQNWTYFSGTVAVNGSDDRLLLPGNPSEYKTITVQPGSGVFLVHLDSALPSQLVRLKGIPMSGTVIVRTVRKVE